MRANIYKKGIVETPKTHSMRKLWAQCVQHLLKVVMNGVHNPPQKKTTKKHQEKAKNVHEKNDQK